MPKLSFLLFLLLMSCSKNEVITVQKANQMFDDFNYESSADPLLENFGWNVRSGNGGPGEPGRSWLKENVSFIADPAIDGNKLMKLTAQTNGTGKGTYQAEISHKLAYLEGTYAARIYFSDVPSMGEVEGDRINQTFFAISPLEEALHPDYSELDFVEYLPNGGWGTEGATFWMTSWETYQESPWIQITHSDEINQSFEGWHIVSASVSNKEVKYYIDGELKATHAEKFYPEQKMRISFNIWFLGGGLVDNSATRGYQELVDWVYFSEDGQLNHKTLPDIVQVLRQNSISSLDEI